MPVNINIHRLLYPGSQEIIKATYKFADAIKPNMLSYDFPSNVMLVRGPAGFAKGIPLNLLLDYEVEETGPVEVLGTNLLPVSPITPEDAQVTLSALRLFVVKLREALSDPNTEAELQRPIYNRAVFMKKAIARLIGVDEPDEMPITVRREDVSGQGGLSPTPPSAGIADWLKEAEEGLEETGEGATDEEHESSLAVTYDSRRFQEEPRPVIDAPVLPPVPEDPPVIDPPDVDPPPTPPAEA